MSLTLAAVQRCAGALVLVSAVVAAPGAHAQPRPGSRTVAAPAAASRASTRARRWYSQAHGPRRGARLRTRMSDRSSAIAEHAYRDLRGATQELLATLPPDRHFYLGIGRSPSALVEMLDAVVPDQAAGLPASGLGKVLGREITDAHRVELDRHLDHFLPDPAKLEGRTLLLMDNVVEGGTLQKLKPELERYVAERGIDARVETLAIAPTRAPVDHQLSGRFDAMAAGAEAIARYGPHHIGVERLEDLRPNPKRSDFVRSLLARLVEDRSFDAFVERGFPLPVLLAERAKVHTVLPPVGAEPTGAGETRAGSMDRSDLERARGQLQRELAERFSHLRFEGGLDRGRRVTTLFIEAPASPAGSEWRVQTPIPEAVWSPRLRPLWSSLEALTENQRAPDHRYRLRITFSLDEHGQLRDSEDVTVERIARAVPVADRASYQGELAVNTDALRQNGGGPGMSATQRAVADAFSGLAFRSAFRTGAVPAVTFELERADAGAGLRWIVRAPMRQAEWEGPLRTVAPALAGLAARDGEGFSRGLRLTVTPNEAGQIEGPEAVSIQGLGE